MMEADWSLSMGLKSWGREPLDAVKWGPFVEVWKRA